MGKHSTRSHWYLESYAAIEKSYNVAASKGATGKHLINAIDQAWPWGDAKRTYRDWVQARRDFMQEHGIVVEKKSDVDPNQIEMFSEIESHPAVDAPNTTYRD